MLPPRAAAVPRGIPGAAAALSVTRMGAQPSIPRRFEIDAFLEEDA